MMSDALDQEVSFLSGFKANGTLAGRSYATWNGDTPATYSNQSDQFKWGGARAGTPGGTVTYAFDPASAFSPAEQQVFLAGLILWSDEANISFALAASGQSADFTFDRNNQDVSYEQNTPSYHAVGTTTVSQPANTIISIDTRAGAFGPVDQPFSAQAFPLSTVVHEEGHLLGLGHAGPYNDVTQNDADRAQLSIDDSQLYSIMSYITAGDQQGAHASQYMLQGQFPYAQTPMIADILAVQRLYGAPVDTALLGGQVFGFNSNISDASRMFFDFTINQTPAVTLFDTGTGNTLDLSGFSSASTVNLSPGSFSSVDGMTNNIAIAEGTAINRVIGGPGADTITGTPSSDAIVGGGGDDTLTGGGGHDAFVFQPDFGQDTITDFATSGPNANGLRFEGLGFNSIGDVLRRTSMVDGSAVIHAPGGQDSVTLLNVTKVDLQHHAHDIVLA